MTDQIETQRSLDPSMNPIMAPPHVVLDDDLNKPHPLTINEDGERINMADEPKRAPDRDQGVSIPEEGAGDSGAADDAEAPVSDGPSEGGGMSQGGGSTGEGGGASQSGGTGN